MSVKTYSIGTRHTEISVWRFTDKGYVHSLTLVDNETGEEEDQGTEPSSYEELTHDVNGWLQYSILTGVVAFLSTNNLADTIITVNKGRLERVEIVYKEEKND